jgi:hypothetical protein
MSGKSIVYFHGRAEEACSRRLLPNSSPNVNILWSIAPPLPMLLRCPVLAEQESRGMAAGFRARFVPVQSVEDLQSSTFFLIYLSTEQLSEISHFQQTAVLGSGPRNGRKRFRAAHTYGAFMGYLSIRRREIFSVSKPCISST